MRKMLTRNGGERYRQETEAYGADEFGDDYCWAGHRAEVEWDESGLCSVKGV